MHERWSHQKSALRLGFKRYQPVAGHPPTVVLTSGETASLSDGACRDRTGDLRLAHFCPGQVKRGQRMSGGDGYAACDSALGPAWATIVSLI